MTDGDFFNWKQFKEKKDGHFALASQRKCLCCSWLCQKRGVILSLIFVWAAIEKTLSFAAGEFPHLWKFKTFLIESLQAIAITIPCNFPGSWQVHCGVLHWSLIGSPCELSERWQLLWGAKKTASFPTWLMGSFRKCLRDPRHSLNCSSKSNLSLLLFPLLRGAVDRDRNIEVWDSCRTEGIPHARDQWLLSWLLRNQTSLFPYLMWFQKRNAWTINVLRSLPFRLYILHRGLMSSCTT